MKYVECATRSQLEKALADGDLSDLQKKLAQGIEHDIEGYETFDKRMVIAYLSGWFDGYLKGEDE